MFVVQFHNHFEQDSTSTDIFFQHVHASFSTYFAFTIMHENKKCSLTGGVLFVDDSANVLLEDSAAMVTGCFGVVWSNQITTS